jgi:hypothetical protein
LFKKDKFDSLCKEENTNIILNEFYNTQIKFLYIYCYETQHYDLKISTSIDQMKDCIGFIIIIKRKIGINGIS